MDINIFLKDNNNFLLLPQTFDKSNVIAYLVMKYFIGRDILIYSNNIDDINKALPQSLPDDFYVHQDNTKLLSSVLMNQNNILLIEDIESFMNKASNMTIYCKLFIIGSYCINDNSVNYIELIKANILRFNIAYIGPTIKYNILTRNIKELLLNITIRDGRQLLFLKYMDQLDDIENHLTEIGKHYLVIEEGNSDIYMDNISKELKNNTLLIIVGKIEREYENIETIHYFDIYKNEYVMNNIYKRKLYNKFIQTLNICYYIDDKNKHKYDKIKSNNQIDNNNYYNIYKKSKIIK